MTDSSAVISLYVILADGSTGERAGTARLLTHQFAVVVPPVAPALLREREPRVRLAIAWPGDAEIIDSVEAARADDAAGEPLLAFRLAHTTAVPAGAPSEIAPPTTDESSTDVVGRVLTHLGGATGSAYLVKPELGGGIVCKVFHHWCGLVGITLRT